MILSQTSEYAIRATSSIALHQHGGPVRARDLSKEISIPLHYLSKVLRRLVEAKILSGSKGHRGGFLLARPPEKIRIIDILEAVESHVPAKHCIFGWRKCNSKAPCILHHRWSKVNDAFQSWARTTTLANICEDASKVHWLMESEELKTNSLTER